MLNTFAVFLPWLAACVSRVLGDEKTSRFTDDICEKILKLANL